MENNSTEATEEQKGSSHHNQPQQQDVKPTVASVISRNVDTFWQLGLYTILIFLVPIMGFLVIAYGFLRDLASNLGDPTIVGAAFAILSVNTIIAVYVYKAFTEEEDERPINTAGEESSLAAEEGSKTSADSVARNRPVSPDIKARRRNVQQ